MKRATPAHMMSWYTFVISIHALVKRATPQSNKTAQRAGDFNPRPREEGDDWEANFPDMYDISIHALVKRATDTDSIHCDIAPISIHALVKRATGGR